MSRSIKLIRHDTPEDWREKIRRIRDNGVKLKMLVIYKILENENVSAEEIQEMFLISPRTMYDWINQYNSGGLEGLKAQNPKGRGSGKGNLQYDNEIYIKLKKEMEANLDKKWTLKEKQDYIKREFGVKPTFPTISKRLDAI